MYCKWLELHIMLSDLAVGHKQTLCFGFGIDDIQQGGLFDI